MAREITDAQIEDTPPEMLATIAAKCFAEFMQRGEAVGPVADAFLKDMVMECSTGMGAQEELEAALEDYGV